MNNELDTAIEGAKRRPSGLGPEAEARVARVAADAKAKANSRTVEGMIENQETILKKLQGRLADAFVRLDHAVEDAKELPRLAKRIGPAAAAVTETAALIDRTEMILLAIRRTAELA